MLEELVRTAGAVLGGGIAGGLVAHVRVRKLNRRSLEVLEPPGDPALDDWIDAAATQWAGANGRPGAKSIIADKVRLGVFLQQRRNARRSAR
jgi:hypothetical protein